MNAAIRGIVKGGLIVPDTPLPEGANVQILVTGAPALTADLQEEFDAWAAGGVTALEAFEAQLDKGADHAQG